MDLRDNDTQTVDKENRNSEIAQASIQSERKARMKLSYMPILERTHSRWKYLA